jgi:dipeptidyl aminopeptidase/acylaminoacyl peptidase
MAIDNKDGSIVYQEKVHLEPTYFSKNVEAFRIKYLSDGYIVVGFIVKPRNIDGEAPILIFNRGGSEERSIINTTVLSRLLSFWANKGYVVLASQYRGNDGGEGKDEFGGSDINDVINLIHVARGLAYVDKEKLCMLGYSRGGMMTYQAIRNNPNIKAAAVIGGVSDLFDCYNNREEAMKRILERLVGHPVRNREEYIKRSAVHWADEINAPTLIFHGGKDWRVPVRQAKELAHKLEEAKKEYRFVEYPDGDHGLKSHFREYSGEILKWFDLYLNE